MDTIDKADPTSFALLVQHLVKHFGSKIAVKDLSFGLRLGETFGLLGRNGSSKTTTIGCITGQHDFTSGSIKIFGQDIATSADFLHQNIAIIPQFDVVWDDLTVRQHLMFYCRVRGVPAKHIQSVSYRAAEEVNLNGDSFGIRAGSLSGGQKRRLSIAMALISQAPILLSDECTTGLSVNARMDVWRVFQRLKAGKKHCIVLTTHNLVEAEALADRVGILVQGKLRCIGTPAHLRNKFGGMLRLKFRVMIFVD